MRFRYFSGLLLLLGSLMMTAVLLSSCTQDKTAPTFEPVASSETTEEQVDTSQDTDFTPQQVLANIDEFTEFECLYCHTDQERLIELAAPEEKAEKLSSGPG